jgi:phage-related minor tail protein
VQQLELRQNIEELKGKFTNLKQEILEEAELELDDNKERMRLSKELDRVEEAIIEIEQAASEQQPRLSAAIKDRFDNFMTSVTDDNSRLNKLLKLVSKGVERAQTVTDLYHKCSSLFESLPVP